MRTFLSRGLGFAFFCGVLFACSAPNRVESNHIVEYRYEAFGVRSFEYDAKITARRNGDILLLTYHYDAPFYSDKDSLHFVLGGKENSSVLRHGQKTNLRLFNYMEYRVNGSTFSIAVFTADRGSDTGLVYFFHPNLGVFMILPERLPGGSFVVDSSDRDKTLILKTLVPLILIDYCNYVRQ